MAAGRIADRAVFHRLLSSCLAANGPRARIHVNSNALRPRENLAAFSHWVIPKHAAGSTDEACRKPIKAKPSRASVRATNSTAVNDYR
jgi:hypothetical protein